MFSHYDLFYADKDYEGEARYLRKFLKGSSVLDLGCGSGRHGRFLQQFGFEVTGIERDAVLIDRCPFEVLQGDITGFNLDKRFDNIVSLFHVVNYLCTEDIPKLFDKVREHLIPGGTFLFEVWYGPAVRHIGASTRVRRASGITRVAIPLIREDGSIEVHYRFSDTKTIEIHIMRPFDVSDIPQGFKLIKMQEFMTSGPASNETWSVLFQVTPA